MADTFTTTVALTTIQAAYGDNLLQLRARLDVLRGVTVYKDVVKNIAQCRALRVQIEERRKLLKADSLEYGRNVDAVAKQLTEAVAECEEPLKLLKADADNAKAREKESKERAERETREAEARAKVEAEQAEARALRQAEEKQLADRRAEFAKLKAEAEAEAAKERAELLELRRQLAQERSEAATQAALAAEELRKLNAAREAATVRARLAAEAEEQREAREKHEAELAAKRAAAEPDVSKLHVWANAFDVLRRTAPSCTDPDARELVENMKQALTDLAVELQNFDGSPVTWQDADPHAALRTFGEVIDANAR